MKRALAIILPLLITVLSCNYLDKKSVNSTSEITDDTDDPGVPPVKGTAWTVMVYMDGDNSLEGFLGPDFQEMKNGFVEDQGLNLIVLVDRNPSVSSSTFGFNANFEGTRLYLVGRGNAFRLSDPDHLNLSDSGDNDEKNMGDANTLKEFVQFCKSEYPADKYALILWNHGSGPQKKLSTGTSTYPANTNKSICEDLTSGGDWLYTAEITDVLSEDESVDLLGFDACFMGSVEVAYQYRPGNGRFNAQFMVASPAEEWVFGWKYNTILARLKNSPGSNNTEDKVMGEIDGFTYEKNYDPMTMSARDLGGVIVEEMYDSTISTNNHTLSLYDLSKAEDVKLKIDILAQNLHSNDDQFDLETVRGSGSNTYTIYYDETLSQYNWCNNPFFDIYDLSDRIDEIDENDGDNGDFLADVEVKANDVKIAVSNMVIYSFSGSAYSKSRFENGKNGLSIFFPDGDGSYLTNTYWYYQDWYNAVSSDNYDIRGHGKLSWCIDGATPDDGSISNWFEMLDNWFDDVSVNEEGDNHYDPD